MTWLEVRRPIVFMGREFDYGAVINLYETSKILPGFFKAVENGWLHVMGIKEIHNSIRKQCDACILKGIMPMCRQNCIVKRGITWQ